MNILMVLKSHGKLRDSGKETGFRLQEFAAPYYVLKDAGASITLASPKGGQPPLDPGRDTQDTQTDATKRFEGDDAAQKTLSQTYVLSEIKVADYDES